MSHPKKCYQRIPAAAELHQDLVIGQCHLRLVHNHPLPRPSRHFLWASRFTLQKQVFQSSLPINVFKPLLANATVLSSELSLAKAAMSLGSELSTRTLSRTLTSCPRQLKISSTSSWFGGLDVPSAKPRRSRKLKAAGCSTPPGPRGSSVRTSRTRQAS
jgi:hypothetical protein